VIGMAHQPRFDATSLVPLYMQAVDHVAARIVNGELAKGAKLPAERVFAEEWALRIRLFAAR